MNEVLEEEGIGANLEQVDHIGIAVEEIEGMLPIYRDLLGMKLDGIEEVPTEHVRTAALDAGNTRIELLEPLHEEGPIQKFLENHGPGIHHICLEVQQLETMMNTCREAGLEPIYEEPESGAGQTTINFLHPQDTSGVLIELSEHEQE